MLKYHNSNKNRWIKMAG